MSTKIVAQKLSGDGDSVPVQIEAGQYMIAVGGEFGLGTVQLRINIGPARAVPIDGAEYDEPKAEVIWLPSCTLYVTLSGALTAADVNVALAELSTSFDR
jgi:hypothetical protein